MKRHTHLWAYEKTSSGKATATANQKYIIEVDKRSSDRDPQHKKQNFKVRGSPFFPVVFQYINACRRRLARRERAIKSFALSIECIFLGGTFMRLMAPDIPRKGGEMAKQKTNEFKRSKAGQKVSFFIPTVDFITVLAILNVFFLAMCVKRCPKKEETAAAQQLAAQCYCYYYYYYY